MPTKVIFRKFTDGDKETIALFPELPWTNDPSTCLSYMHMGQHGAADIYPYSTVPAKPAEYAELLSELVSVGYDDLKVCHRATYGDYNARRREISHA